ncbi:MAG: 2-succinyl-5-enolpyruvyl-6-hydroxy-3-cyclohexene-1-carboxylic-acid synthase [Actinobacteria bacterium]|nr:2-succinyl-5-enolpyruvyl-6-hydroxy-3-cyclohexene-1-carboxylic-acid synthase [Actinomycetota bacterium]
MNTATNLARAIVVRLLSEGITDVVLSPGSRNAPLSIALFAAEQKSLITLHVHIDERSAGFFALGISKASNRPVAIVCTSGTAVANYHPAILEAWHSQVPLLVLTADRPARLRETGANQTTLQSGIFMDAVAYSADVEDMEFDFDSAFDSLSTGPVHLNVQFDEPLLPDDEADWLVGLTTQARGVISKHAAKDLHIDTQLGVIVVGHDRAGFSVEDLEEFAGKVGWPILVEDPLSFKTSIAHASLFLTASHVREVLKPECVIVIGRTTLSRSINALIKSAGREIVIDPRIEFVDTKRVADEIFFNLPTPVGELMPSDEWLARWKDYSAKTESLIRGMDAWGEPTICGAISESLENGSAFYLSSSRPIRDIEGFSTPRAGVETFANRGLAGIDGNISTSVGIASQRKSTTALMGDLSFLHDHNGLLSAQKVALRIIVLNNNGGGIFSTLPQNGVKGFEKIFGTPHGYDLAAISSALGIRTVTVSTVAALKDELVSPIVELSVVIVELPSREKNAEVLRSLYEAIAKF